MDDATRWMHHSLQMASARLKSAKDRQSALSDEIKKSGRPTKAQAREQSELRDTITNLKHEVDVRKFCLANRDRDYLFAGSAAVWRRYIQSHAELQMLRYAGELPEGEFRHLCLELRWQRDKDDPRDSQWQWLEKDAS